MIINQRQDQAEGETPRKKQMRNKKKKKCVRGPGFEPGVLHFLVSTAGRHAASASHKLCGASSEPDPSAQVLKVYTLNHYANCALSKVTHTDPIHIPRRKEPRVGMSGGSGR